MTRRKDAATDPSTEALSLHDQTPADTAPEGRTERPVPDMPPEEATTVPEGLPDSARPDSARPDTAQPDIAQPARRSGILGPLLGGAIAAVAGFGLSHFNVFGLNAPDQSDEVAALAQRLDSAVAALEAGQSGLQAAQQQGIEGLAARIMALEGMPAADLSGLADLEQRLGVIEALPPGGDASTAALAAQLAEMDRRLAALPEGGASTDEVDAALARLAEVEAEALARADAAVAAAEAAAEAQALEVLKRAAASGAAFEAELAAVADPDLQAQLAPHVAGVAALESLQAAFPDAARAALQVARAGDAEAGWGARVVDFLGAQTGARSIAPREGDSPDAILSRAEFALTEGRLADALAETATLAPDVQTPLAEWIARAEARLAVEAALAGGL